MIFSIIMTILFSVTFFFSSLYYYLLSPHYNFPLCFTTFLSSFPPQCNTKLRPSHLRILRVKLGEIGQLPGFGESRMQVIVIVVLLVLDELGEILGLGVSWCNAWKGRARMVRWWWWCGTIGSLYYSYKAIDVVW